MTASTNFSMLLPFLKERESAVSQEIALPHWARRVGQVAGVRPSGDRNSNMNLQRPRERECGAAF